MHRPWTLLALVPLLACGGTATRPPAHQRSTVTAAPAPGCPEPNGCGVVLEAEPRFEPPGEAWIPPAPDGALTAGSTCATIGQVLAAVELGNYADPNELAPAIARHTARCEQLALDPATLACALEQSDRASIAYCAPTMFPGEAPPIVEPRACDGLIAAIGKRTSTRSTIDDERRWWEPRAAAFLASCRTERWTQTYAECAKSNHPSNCTYGAVKPLQVAISALVAREDAKQREARAAWEAAYAAPNQHPKVKLELVSARGCGDLLRAVQKRIDALHPADWQHNWWKPRAAGVRRSCLHDRWPKDFGQCSRERGPNQCQAFAPRQLQQKLQVVFQQPAVPAKPAKPAKRRGARP